MAFAVPYRLSPSKVASFTDCALAFRFSAIDRLPEPPAPWSTKGTLVHAALQRLYRLPNAERTVEAALASLEAAAADLSSDPEYCELELSPEETVAFHDDAAELVQRYFQIEDPTAVNAIGLELSLDVEIDGVRIRGIIDRLDLDEDGELVVTDYKTGSVPSVQHERKRLSGVHIYSLMCEELLGRRPKRVQLLYLKQPMAIITEPTDQSTRGTRRTLAAVWQAVERACEREDFRPQKSRLCDFCTFRAYCPAFGGNPDAAQELLQLSASSPQPALPEAADAEPTSAEDGDSAALVVGV